ncbi:hypothetical protein [Embleya sp. NBC_00896]|uniref:hypothetical protein n=1 Tax=Embleya sp. NBC_00896 TaxID=2975961 RepID=UPI002F912038|nr:hypothetical protein OG928_33975 [Embleya sp. NBC_00896]
MRLHIVHDEDGRILAAAPVETEDYRGVVPQQVFPRPLPVSPEHTAVELEVPHEYREGSLLDICGKLSVDPQRKKLVARTPS